jgi:ABC-2 type transport system permease protein
MTPKSLPFTISLRLLISYRVRELKNLFAFGGTRTRMWSASILLIGGLFIWLDYMFFFKLIQAIQEKLEFLAPYMLGQLIHTLFLSFFGLLALSSMTSSVSGFFMSREVPFLLTAPVDFKAFLIQRFGLVFTQSAWMIIIFGAPPFIAYSSRLGLSWNFLVGWFPVFLLLIIIPVLLGSSCGIVLMRLLPASRVNQALSFLTLAIGALIIILFRMSRPERLFMDVPQEEVMAFVQAMSVPDSVFMPTSWATSAVVGLGSDQMGGVYLLNLLYLLIAAAGCALLLFMVFRSFYWRGLSSLDEGQIRKARKDKGFLESSLERLPPFLGSYLSKDVLIFVRDPSRWTQLFLLGALVVLYVYNAYSFPLGGFFYRNLVAFLNLAITGFVLSALCVRFVFPSISLEGLSMWITMSAPVPMRRFFLAKYIFAAAPLCLISLILSVTTNMVMKVDSDMMVLFGGASVAMALALVGLNLGMGAVFPRFQYENEAQIPASPGGVVTMIISLAYIGFMIVFMAAPVYRFFASPMGLTALTKGDAVFGLAGALLLSAAVAVIPVGFGLRRVGQWGEGR